MKFSWGTGILMVIIAFLLAVLGFFIFSSQQEYQLVEEDYYPKELKYGETIEKINNAARLGEKIRILQAGESVVFTFPSVVKGKTAAGTILVYRPSDARKDFTVPVQTDPEGQQVIPTSSMIPGKYIFKIDWSLEGISYYQEEEFILN